MGGCLNLLIPGLGCVYAGNWPMAIATFIVVGVILVVLLGLLLSASDPDALVCIFPVFLGIFAYLFFAGRRAVIKSNEKAGK
jgi:uncharacterized membrane protein YfcA